MATKANSTTSKTKQDKEASKADQVHQGLLAKAVEAGQHVEAIEFDLVQEFAKVVTAGKLSVRGFAATVTEAKAQGAAFAYITAGMGQHIETIANLAAADSTPRTMTLDQLSTLAVRMAKTAKPTDKKVNKQEAARVESAALKRKAASFAENEEGQEKRAQGLAKLASKVEAAWKAQNQNKSNSNKSKSGNVTSVTLNVTSINALAELVRKSEGKFTDEVANALGELGVVIEVWLGATVNA